VDLRETECGGVNWISWLKTGFNHWLL